MNPRVYLQRRFTKGAAEAFPRVRILVVAIQIGLTEELLIAVRAGERPLASVFIQMTLERGGARELPTLAANVVLEVLSFLTSVCVLTVRYCTCSAEAPPTEIADERRLAGVYFTSYVFARDAPRLWQAVLA